MTLPAHLRKRAKAKSLYDGAALGTYRGPERTTEPPRLTTYRRSILQAIADGEIKAGQGQYTNAWRWHSHASKQSTTVTKTVVEFIRCKWAKVAGSHAELTEAGQSALDGAPL